MRVLLADLPGSLTSGFRNTLEAAGSCELVIASGEIPESRDFALCVFVAPSDRIGLIERTRTLKKALRATPLVTLCPRDDPDMIVDAMRAGAADALFLSRSAREIVARCCTHISQPVSDEGFGSLVGTSAAIAATRRAVEAVAANSSTVLLSGETGTGKGLAARCIHERSQQRSQPLVHVDCAALAPTVIESELFGHERGAFTGALARRPGRFELAERGTIFLDEIAELEPGLQGKLLRVLQDREYERLGGRSTIKMSARVIAATNRDLRREIDAGRFREDLYYRLNVFHIEMPPLRDRLEDVPIIVERELGAICERLAVPVPTISDGALARLQAHPWPGNVRELLNCLERMCAQARGELVSTDPVDAALDRAPRAAPQVEPTPQEAPAGFRPPAGVPSDATGLAETLRATGGNVARTARRLGVPRSTLRYWIDRRELGHLIPRD